MRTTTNRSAARPVLIATAAAAAAAGLLVTGGTVANAAPLDAPVASGSSETDCTVRMESRSFEAPSSDWYRVVMDCNWIAPGVEARGVLDWPGHFDERTGWYASGWGPMTFESGWQWDSDDPDAKPRGVRLELAGPVNSAAYNCRTWKEKEAKSGAIDEYRVGINCARIDDNVRVMGTLDRVNAGDQRTPPVDNTMLGQDIFSDWWQSYPEPRGTFADAYRV